jgi:hypothetical protein
MYRGGGHLGFPIGIKSIKFVEDLYADRKSKMAAIAGPRLALDPKGKCSNAFLSETTNIIKAKLYMNVHWTPIGSNVNLCIAVAAILDFRSK